MTSEQIRNLFRLRDFTQANTEIQKSQDKGNVFLELRSVNLDSEGLKHLIKALPTSKIISLDIALNKLTDEDTPTLIDFIKQHPELKNLEYAGNNISDKNISLIQEQLFLNQHGHTLKAESVIAIIKAEQNTKDENIPKELITLLEEAQHFINKGDHVREFIKQHHDQLAIFSMNDETLARAYAILDNNHARDFVMEHPYKLTIISLENETLAHAFAILDNNHARDFVMENPDKLANLNMNDEILKNWVQKHDSKTEKPKESHVEKLAGTKNSGREGSSNSR